MGADQHRISLTQFQYAGIGEGFEDPQRRMLCRKSARADERGAQLIEVAQIARTVSRVLLDAIRQSCSALTHS